jgi:hypothetical protein
MQQRSSGLRRTKTIQTAVRAAASAFDAEATAIRASEHRRLLLIGHAGERRAGLGSTPRVTAAHGFGRA